MNATTHYKQTRKELMTLIEMLKSEVKELDQVQKQNPDRWDTGGTLNSVSYSVRSIVASMRGIDPENLIVK